jgi:hypothetical protein
VCSTAASVERTLSGAGMLVRNYRSHQQLLELPSRMFYQVGITRAESWLVQPCTFICNQGHSFQHTSLVHAVITRGSSQPRLGPSPTVEPLANNRWVISHHITS